MADRSQTSILQLPEEILFKIFELAGCCSSSNHNIRLVCKQFYRVYCTFTLCGLTFASSQVRDDVFRSMMYSLRRPSRFDIKYPEECTDDSRLKKIVEHFATHVRTLLFERCDENEHNKMYRIVDVALIMNLMVNVEEITFTRMKIYGYVEEPSKNPTIEMKMLKKFVLMDCVDAESINGLLACVSATSLEELYVHSFTETALNFNQFFVKNQSIKSVAMAISGEEPRVEAMKHLQLSKLQFYFDKDSNGNTIRDVVAHQPKLKFLNLLPEQDDVPYDFWFDEDGDASGIVHDDVFNIICTLKDLESLQAAIGQVTPDAIGKIADLTNLKKLVLNASGNESGFDNDYDYDVSQMRSDVLFQKCFQKLIITPLPHLESLTWTLKNCEWDNEYFMSDDEELMENARRKEYSSLSRVNVIATMAPSFPRLKYLRIEMKTNDASDSINVRDALKRFRHLETLQLKTSSTFEGGPISMHEHIKHVEINEIEKKFLIEMLDVMPNVEILVVRNTVFSLDKSFLQSLQCAIPHRLKKLELKFDSRKRQDFAVENVVILQNIVKTLQKGRVKLTGNCDFDSLADKIDRSVGVSLPRSPKWYVPGDYDDHESYMELLK